MKVGAASQGKVPRRGATLVELLAAMAILSVLVVVLGSALGVALERFRRGSEDAEQGMGLRLAAAWIERDFAVHRSSRWAPLSRLPPGASEVQRVFFEDRVLLPFEVDRRSASGPGEGRSFANAAPEFSSMAFVTQATLSEAPAVVGYYVAFARHGRLKGDGGAGMKLFRHYRPCGHATAEGYADGLIRRASLAINDTSDGSDRPLTSSNAAAVRLGRLENGDFPFLFAERIDAGPGSPVRRAVQPWPSLPVVERLVSPPPTMHPRRGDASAWGDPGDAVHDPLFPDESLCDHVVRFEVVPYRKVVLSDGGILWMAAAQLNDHLGLPQGGEWPALVAPDVLEVTIGVVPEETALRMTRYEDWIVDWSNERIGGGVTDPVLKSCQTHRFRIALPPRSS